MKAASALVSNPDRWSHSLSGMFSLTPSHERSRCHAQQPMLRLGCLCSAPGFDCSSVLHSSPILWQTRLLIFQEKFMCAPVAVGGHCLPWSVGFSSGIFTFQKPPQFLKLVSLSRFGVVYFQKRSKFDFTVRCVNLNINLTVP